MGGQNNSQELIIKKDGPVWRVILNRPEKKNAINDEMFAALKRLAEEITSDPNLCRVVVFSGAGDVFCSGGDLKTLMGGGYGGDISAVRNEFRGLQRILDQVEGMPVPTIAAIHGYALGAGLQLALACDFRIAAEDAMLGLPDVKNGFIPGIGATTRLPRLIGLARAKELLLMGTNIDAKKALDFGLVNAAVPLDELEPAVEEWCSRLIRRAPMAVAAGKYLLNTWADLEETADVQMKLLSSEDAKEGVTAFFERRAPVFKGK
ncbi:3-hydroxypropionyl-coenzyme A dehydratase [Desulfatibacillum alkenivorans DSM 16219]|jgi:enoyl-CoA hydratase/carnithine racemase|uniref:3-hydroxypropionyl-coenzyme A dehydratase n=1 Tax=Desulfatibacillum alkenivorans DSM 16219 TaxID=1121393 RepID=A0A1M6UNS0_9BACT|nr:enoyl-CoA hydratase-related protein [Desulfatibacillum alkenivorans]SHK70854.1 3-hydroxypropionyl-coenzyme A dehydratase [Desulfatibacillum alkenivorans DSM 16219]